MWREKHTKIRSSILIKKIDKFIKAPDKKNGYICEVNY